jgi:flagellar basal-body rod protein FlgF
MSTEISGIASAMDQKIMQLDYMTSNLANAGTTGFKATHLHVLENIADEKPEQAETQSPYTTFVDFSQGVPQKTENPLDVHIQGDGFFVINTKEGQAFTRKGDFTLNNRRQLVTQSGDTVEGLGGPITLMDGKIQIAGDGTVTVGQNQLGKLKIVDFTNRQALSYAGDSLYRDSGNAGLKKAGNTQILSGFIEMSNVNIIREMADMISVQRSFEAYQKIIQSQSELDKLSTSRVGHIA